MPGRLTQGGCAISVGAVRTCPGCGAPVPEGARFCPGCGAGLSALLPAQEQRKTVTVLFADVTGSTELGERLDPESLRRVLARFFGLARIVIERHGGSVEKFIGDAVMAVFGVPQLHEDDALRAVRAAAELRSGLAGLNGELRHDFGTALQLRIGVNTGEVVTGTMERLATGDAVNVAARLEQTAGPDEIVLGEPTVGLVRDAVRVAELPPAHLKGKSALVRVFRLVELATTTRRMDTPMVGRAGQLQMLKDAFGHVVRERTCSLFTLLGTAGVGKSRLVMEFLSGVDAAVLHGRCLSYGEGITYWPVVEMVKQLPAGDLTASLAASPTVAAAIAALLGDEPVVTSPADIAWAVRLLWEHLAKERPLVLVLDDLHWGEPTLFDLIEHVTDLSRDAPILLLCVARPELLERRPGWGGGKLNASTVLLEPLNAEETDELIGRLVPSDAFLDPAVRQKVREAAGGNPLFVEEMLALADAAGSGSVTVPPTIQALLAARLDQLDPGERRVLESGSVEGKSFHRGAVQALAPDEPGVPAQLIGLVRKDLVRPDRAIFPSEDAFRFRHVLIRDAAYDGLPKSVRAELHERFARWLDERGADLVERDEIVGYHLEQAYRYRAELGPADSTARALAAEAATRLAAAGRRGQLRDDVGAVANLLARALVLLGPDRVDLSLELDLSDALMAGGQLSEAVSRADSAVERAAAAGDRVGELRARLIHGRMLMNTDPPGRVGDLRRLVDQARPVIEASGDDAALTAFWAAIAELAHFRCQFGARFEAASAAARFARRSGDLRAERHCRRSAAMGVVWGPTRVEDGLRWLEQAQRDSPAHEPWFDGARAFLLGLAGRVDEARLQLETARAAFAERGETLASAGYGQEACSIELAAGDLVAAERVAREGCEQLERMGERGLLSTAASQLAQTLYALGRYDQAASSAQQAAELGDVDDAFTQALVRQVRAKLAARRGCPDEARRLANEAIEIAERMDAPVPQAEAALDHAEVLGLAGDHAAAAAEIRRAIDLFTAKGATAYARQAARRLQQLGQPEPA
jgi:class 3 adenylate cyclase/tetratricopeptide (TPR) repeat protein